jgi:hypothetical protein
LKNKEAAVDEKGDAPLITVEGSAPRGIEHHSSNSVFSVSKTALT